MNWVKLAEHKPNKCERVLIRFEDGYADCKIRYTVAWYDAGLWWMDAKHALSRQYDTVTHWTKIEPPSDVLVDVVE